MSFNNYFKILEMKKKNIVRRNTKEQVAEHNNKFEESLKTLEPFNHKAVRRSQQLGLKLPKKTQAKDLRFSIMRGDKRKIALTEERHSKIKAWKQRMKIHQARFST